MTTAKHGTAAAPRTNPPFSVSWPRRCAGSRRGDLKVRLPRRAGMAGEVADAFNDVVALQERQNLRRCGGSAGSSAATAG